MIGRLTFLLLGLALALLAGCRHTKAYERGKLAHPTMVTSSFSGPAEEHMYSVQEGATGGGAAAESGCGCN
jgi:hypothetical protein